MEGAQHLSHALGQSDHVALAVGARGTGGLWGALNAAASLLCAKRVSGSWRTSWDNQELRCKRWRYRFWPPTESCIRDSSPEAGRNVVHHVPKWTRSFQEEMGWKTFQGLSSQLFIVSRWDAISFLKLRSYVLKLVTFFFVSVTPTGTIFRFLD